MNWNDIIFMLPEIIIAAGASLMLIAPVTGLRNSASAKWSMIGVLAITAASLIACSWAVMDLEQTHYFGRMFALDGFSIFFKLLFIGAIAVILLACGLCFKVAAVPFHVWTPDVYEGAPTPITAFLSTASKAAAFAIFARIFYTGLHDFHGSWNNVLATVSALSMIVGNLAAITQNNVKRMLAYSSIAHAGYALLGIIAVNEMGLRGVLVYTFVYVFANLGIWSIVLMMKRHEYAGEQVSDFEGLHARAPFWAFAMFIFLLSLGGIPPTAGFIGKYFLFYAAVQAGCGWLAVIAVLMSAVSMCYYLRLVVAMLL